MKVLIQQIINEIPKNMIFDSHAVIFKLVQNYSDEYLKNHNKNESTIAYHGRIGQLIATFEKDAIERIGISWSKNIRDNFSECTCWKKL